MIGYLKGKILDSSEGKLLLVPGDSGIGYVVSVPVSDAYRGLNSGQSCEVFVYTHVREDALDLFGFLSKDEKDLFLTLLNVNGIGPRGALGILSGAEPQQFIRAILEEDKDFLTSIPGVGKKTAERMIMELSDSLRKKSQTGEPTILRDARSALVGLGYRDADVSALLKKVMSETGRPPEKAEDLVRTALRQLT